MKFFVQHPYKERIELNIGAITQIVGQNKELKYYIWQILSWYFGGKKYSSDDLSIFDYEEPTILDESGEIVKRSSYHYIEISSFKDLLEQMEYKKGTLAHGYLGKIVNQVDIVAHLEKINEQVELIEGAMNQHINLNSGKVEYHLENRSLTLDQLLSKNFSPFFAIENKNLSFEWVSNTDKLSLFLEMLDRLLSQTTEKYLIVLKNIDSFYKQIGQLVKKYPNLNLILFPSNQGYLKIDEENSRFVNILSDQVEHLYDIEFMYDRVKKHYPSNNFPPREGFRKSLENVTPYLLTKMLRQPSLTLVDSVILNILNQLFQFNYRIRYSQTPDEELLHRYLESKN
ncbi:CRISPR-associated protein Csn2-St [Streptococcus salivarius]